MKYIGVSTPAWTLLPRREDGFRSASPNAQYRWEQSLEALKKRKGKFKFYDVDRTTLEHIPMDKEPEKQEDARGAQKLQKAQENLKVKQERLEQKRRNREKILARKQQAEQNSSNDGENEPSLVVPLAEDDMPVKLGFFSRKRRFIDESKISNPNVGPGVYNLQASLLKFGSVSMGYKHEQDALIQPKEGVGPGQYDPNFSQLESTKSMKIKSGLEQRVLERVLNSGLGPGHYNHTDPPASDKSFHSKKGTFGNAKKDTNPGDATGARIGPASYNPNFASIQQGMKFHPQRRGVLGSRAKRYSLVDEQSVGQAPGPGSYEVAPKRAKSLGASIGNSKHYQGNMHKRSPGPARYEIPRLFEKGSQTTAATEKKDDYCNFGSCERGFVPKYKKNLPGPADYEVKIPSSNVAVSIKGKNRHQKDMTLEVPGPGKYDLSQAGFFFEKRNLRVVAFRPLHKKRNSVPKETPGPATYDPKYTQLQPEKTEHYGINFTKEKRNFTWQQGDPQIDTGPGIYDLKSTIPQLQPYENPEVKERGLQGLFE